jgi:hypothetical protein
MGEWQPIETAPKAPDDSGECWTVLGYYAGGLISPVYGSSDGWWPTCFDSPAPWMPPLFWQPLPEPPSDEATDAAIEGMKKPA